jgi:hypothetical protein
MTGHSPVEALGVKRNGRVRWFDADESHYVGLKVPATVNSNVDYTLPAGPPAQNGQVLSGNTNGELSWVTPSAGGGEANTGSNVGTGAQVFKEKNGADLRFRSLVDGKDAANQRTCEVVQGTDEITVRAIGVCPVGTILPWLKSHAGNPYGANLPDGWVECDGRTIPNEYGGPFAGKTIPNLINRPADENHAAGRAAFLRGAQNSGSVGGTEVHDHGIQTQTYTLCTNQAGSNVQPDGGSEHIAELLPGRMDTQSEVIPILIASEGPHLDPRVLDAVARLGQPVVHFWQERQALHPEPEKNRCVNIAQARTEVLKMALKRHKKAQRFLFLDADIVPPADTVWRQICRRLLAR